MLSKIEEYKQIVIESEKANPHSSSVCLQLLEMHGTLETQTVRTPVMEETTLVTEPVLDDKENRFSPRKTDTTQHTLVSDMLPPYSDPVSENDEEAIPFEDILQMDEESMRLLSKEDLLLLLCY